MLPSGRSTIGIFVYVNIHPAVLVSRAPAAPIYSDIMIGLRPPLLCMSQSRIDDRMSWSANIIGVAL